MRFTDIFDQRDIAALKFADKFVRQPVEPLDMSKEYGSGLIRDRRKNFRGIHPQCPGIDIHKYRFESILQHGRNIRDPCQRRHDDLSSLWMADLENGHGQEIRRRTRIDEHAVLHPQPRGPFGLKGSYIGAMRQDRILLLEMLDHGVEILAKNIIAHQREFHYVPSNPLRANFMNSFAVNQAKSTFPRNPRPSKFNSYFSP